MSGRRRRAVICLLREALVEGFAPLTSVRRTHRFLDRPRLRIVSCRAGREKAVRVEADGTMKGTFSVTRKESFRGIANTFDQSLISRNDFVGTGPPLERLSPGGSSSGEGRTSMKNQEDRWLRTLVCRVIKKPLGFQVGPD